MQLTVACSKARKREFTTQVYRTHSTTHLRSSFLNFFRKLDHTVVPSSNLVPAQKDSSLLFTNSGMVQFKDFFLLDDKSALPYKRAVSVQKCLRVGGKHNDLENVGYTARHQTFFEMLGNFSFGSYGKREAINYAWKYLTKEIGLPTQRLAVSVYEEDEESANIWKKDHGIPSARIMKFGKKDNFWSMGDNDGPCGPCTEIFWEHDKEIDGEKFLEIWNLVFMQYRQFTQNGKLEYEPLKSVCIDTGMGLERLASVLQDKPTNFHIDSFVPVRELIAQKFSPSTTSNLMEASTRIISDHVRAAAFLLAEGVLPDNVGHGYVLRKILRRAAHYAYRCGISSPFLADLIPVFLQQESALVQNYPELLIYQKHIQRIISSEEAEFLTLFGNAKEKLNSMLKNPSLRNKFVQDNVLDGYYVFDLYSTHGLPMDVTSIFAEEIGLKINTEQFNEAMQKCSLISKGSWKVNIDNNAEDENGTFPPQLLLWESLKVSTEFTGYTSLRENSAKVVASYFSVNKNVAWLAINPCPFYPQGGGQPADEGYISFEIPLQLRNVSLRVVDAVRPFSECIAIKVEIKSESDKTVLRTFLSNPDAIVTAVVDDQRRESLQQAHTAVHLLQASLRTILGTHVVQSGSHLSPNVIRFDFTHTHPLSPEQTRNIEDWVNQVIVCDRPVETDECPYSEAVNSSALAFFGERYPTRVRVVSIEGFSKEICGGTHVSHTGSIMTFKIVKEGSIARGRRRIEAVVGMKAISHLQCLVLQYSSISSMLNVELNSVQDKVRYLLSERSSLKAEVNTLKSQLASRTTRDTTQSDISTDESVWSGELNGNKVLVCHANSELPFLRQRGEAIAQLHPDTILVLLNKTNIITMTTLSGVHSGNVLKNVLDAVGGKGGGNAKYAEGKLNEYSAKIIQTLKTILCCRNTSNNDA